MAYSFSWLLRLSLSTPVFSSCLCLLSPFLYQRTCSPSIPGARFHISSSAYKESIQDLMTRTAIILYFKTLPVVSKVQSLREKILCKITFSPRNAYCTLAQLKFCSEISPSGIYIHMYHSLKTSWRGLIWYFIPPRFFLPEMTEFLPWSLATRGTKL